MSTRTVGVAVLALAACLSCPGFIAGELFTFAVKRSAQSPRVSALGTPAPTAHGNAT